MPAPKNTGKVLERQFGNINICGLYGHWSAKDTRSRIRCTVPCSMLYDRLPFVHRIQSRGDSSDEQHSPSSGVPRNQPPSAAHMPIRIPIRQGSVVIERECLLKGTQILGIATIRIPVTNETAVYVFKP